MIRARGASAARRPAYGSVFCCKRIALKSVTADNTYKLISWVIRAHGAAPNGRRGLRGTAAGVASTAGKGLVSGSFYSYSLISQRPRVDSLLCTYNLDLDQDWDRKQRRDRGRVEAVGRCGTCGDSLDITRPEPRVKLVINEKE
ncbi:hypothetical protein EVAR_98321_1 [Eumeta japonica]|uniref:Uncharacterized protein n=1 Tax=Eumeta variegata TaxID=151549 RepID=A0A4C1XDC7_EUMVA|nr:hypothetical protein EVAR_98321_1 [Eumeta japonica]